jgi:hypothetical protein
MGLVLRSLVDGKSVALTGRNVIEECTLDRERRFRVRAERLASSQGIP